MVGEPCDAAGSSGPGVGPAPELRAVRRWQLDASGPHERHNPLAGAADHALEAAQSRVKQAGFEIKHGSRKILGATGLAEVPADFERVRGRATASGYHRASIGHGFDELQVRVTRRNHPRRSRTTFDGCWLRLACILARIVR